MLATEYLRPHIDMMKILKHFNFDSIREEGDLIRSACAIHGGDRVDAFVVNTKNNLYYCHTGGCGGGDVFTLVQEMMECSFQESVRFVADFFEVDISNMEVAQAKAKEQKELDSWMRTLLDRKVEPHSQYDTPDGAKQVVKFRGFNRETLEKFNLMHIDTLDLLSREGRPYTIKNRLAFPIIQDSTQIGMSYRAVNPKDVPKWTHQPGSIRTKDILYNYDSAIGKSNVAVVEGIPDVWAYDEIGVTAVCTFGAHLTAEQYKMLMRTGADIDLSYDGDNAGKEITRKAIEMFKNVANVRVVQFEVGQDPESISREELLSLYEQRSRV